jgi:neutral ceramidase
MQIIRSISHLVRVARTCSVRDAVNHEAKTRNNRFAFVRCALVLVVIVAALGRVAVPAAASEPVPVGVAKIDITPEHPVRMYGYGARKTESEGVAGRLKASALALGGDEGEGPAVLLTVDCGAVIPRIRNEVLRRVQAKFMVKPERFILSNSHNHSGPDLKGMDSLSGGERERLVQYADQLTDRLEQVVLQALASRKPGHLAWTQGTVAFAANRRVLKDGKWVGFGAVADAPVDHSLPLMRVTDSQGKLLAVVVNYACHNTTLRGNFKQIHGDWAACAQEYIEADHPGTIAMITIGCGADADPCPHSTVELCQQHGRSMADEVKRLLAGPLRPVDFKLTAKTITLDIPCDPVPPSAELEQLAKRSHPARRLLQSIERGEKPPASVTYQLGTWVFDDDLAMVFMSDEVVVDYALRLKRELGGERLWISAYCNDVSRYIVSKRLLDEGGYEARNSLGARVTYGHPERLDPTMEDRIVDAVRSLLPEMTK